MATRLPMQPPVLPGFTHLHILGSGGFADVFLYEQSLPRRPVAVKVMLADLVDDDVRRTFRSEVDVSGRLASHPHILTIYSASVAGDGRPYIVMELCSNEVGERYRTRPYELYEALDMMIKIGSALEAAHREGTVHRDVKPANIMLTAYGHPVLSDFGIAGTAADLGATGVSVPWAAPEVLRDETGGTVASDIFAFGATFFSLVVGRSPAEVVGRSNRPEQLAERIRAGDWERPPTAWPPRLREAISRAMSKRPADRHQSVQELLEVLQLVQQDLGEEPTPIEAEIRPFDMERPVESETVEELPLRKRPSRRRSASAVRIGSQIDISSSAGVIKAEPDRRRALVGIAVSVATVVVLGCLAVVAVALSTLAGHIPTVEAVVGEPTSDGVTFSWNDPGLVDNDSYQVRTSRGESIIQSGTTFTMSGESGEELCITVFVNRDGSTGEGAEACGAVQ